MLDVLLLCAHKEKNVEVSVRKDCHQCFATSHFCTVNGAFVHVSLNVHLSPFSSLGRELLVCILDVLDVPDKLKDSDIGEDDFKRILDWCDIWVVLLKTTGMFVL